MNTYSAVPVWNVLADVPPNSRVPSPTLTGDVQLPPLLPVGPLMARKLPASTPINVTLLAFAATVAGFTAEALTHRVTALLTTPTREPDAAGRGLPLGVAALVLSAPVLHHATETVLSLLARP